MPGAVIEGSGPGHVEWVLGCMVWARGGVVRGGCGDLIPLVAAVIFNYPLLLSASLR